jgi:2,3,4,5-tetrahydropyridine-2-carboxylate N-succinyltransferase
MNLQETIAAAWADRELLKTTLYSEAVEQCVEEVDKGRLRTASPSDNGGR